MTILIFDTSTLRETQKSVLEPLENLCSLDVITIIIPEIVLREYTTGVLQDALIPSSIRKHLRRACNWLDKNTTDVLNTSLINLENFSKDGEELIEAGIRQWLMKIHGEVEPFSSSDLARVLHNYFSGNPPFSGKKSRTDLPDAFVFDAVRRASEQDEVVAFISDGRLKRACETLDRVSVFSSLHSFYKSDMFGHLRVSAREMLEEVQENRLELEQDRLVQIIELLGKQTAQAGEMIEHRLFNELQGTEFTDYFLDTYIEAVINKIIQIYNIDFDWESSILISSDIISVHVIITANTLVESLIPRRDFLQIPDNIEHHFSVTKFDWDENFLWLERNAEITVEGVADFRVAEYDYSSVYLGGLQSLVINEVYKTG